MYRDRLWTMRQYAGFASPEDTNERYRYLIEHGSTGLSMAFDLPTQLGRDSDDPLCNGEVGRTGVPIDTIEDMRICFDQIPLDGVSTSMTINAPAAILLLLYELVGEEQGVPSEKLRGTVQNDVLKEYMARGNYIYPPEPTMRLTTDIFEYCHDERAEMEHDLDLRVPHPREGLLGRAGGRLHALQRDRLRRGGARAGPEDRRVRAAPRLLLQLPQQRLPGDRQVPRGAADVGEDRQGALRGREPEIDEDPLPHPDRRRHPAGPAARGQHHPRRPAGLRRGRGGTQSLHTNGFDEALALPTERSARIALRTQQVLAYESGVADTVDPFAGSYFVESLTDEIELRAWELMDKVDELGGSVEALEFMQREIEESAHSYHERYRSRPGHHRRRQQIRHRPGRRRRHPQGRPGVRAAPADPAQGLQGGPRPGRRSRPSSSALRDVARGDGNLLHPIRAALAADASIGEVCGAMRDVFGEYKGGAFF